MALAPTPVGGWRKLKRVVSASVVSVDRSIFILILDLSLSFND